jgi:hypothetical protein
MRYRRTAPLAGQLRGAGDDPYGNERLLAEADVSSVSSSARGLAATLPGPVREINANVREGRRRSLN